MHVVADFNGDTHPDVITASESNAPVHSISLRLLTNDGTGTLTLVPGFSLPFEGTLTAVDIDRDGDQDLAIIIGDDLILRRNDGQANFGAAETIIAGMAGWPAFGDFNGDNRTDVVVAIGTPGVAVALANASGGFLRRSFTPSPAVRTAWPILPTSTATAASTSSPSRETRTARRRARAFCSAMAPAVSAARSRPPTTSCTCRRWRT